MPRYGPAEQLLRLILDLASTRTGLTIGELQDRLGVGRRTVERLLEAARRFVEVEQAPALDDRRKRWRVRTLPRVLAEPSAEELAALELAAHDFAEDGLEAHGDALSGLAAKLKAAALEKAGMSLELDLETLLEAEGFASRPGPRPEIDPEIFGHLRFAVLWQRKVEIHYRYRTRPEEATLVVHPYGFLYGARHYLVGWSECSRPPGIRSFALPNVLSVSVLEAGFVPAPDFSMAGYTRRMFGVFREEPSNVVWRFSAEAAPDARQFRFHPDQILTDLPDGRVEVAFRAGGLQEMAWHLFRWGDHVEIVSPPELRAMLVEMLETALAAHGGSAAGPAP